MRTLTGAVAVITGAGSGIGRALALRLARERCDLAIADIDPAGLAETAVKARASRINVSTHAVDVADRVAMTEFRDAVLGAHGRVNLLVNNAGVVLLGNVTELTLDEIAWLMGINFWGVVHGIKLFLPVLQQQADAHIVNLSSIFGIVAPPGNAPYAASKFAVRGFSEALGHELALARSKVKVTTVHPGGIRTPIAARARLAAAVGEARRSDAVARFEKMARTSPEAAAERILRGVLAGEKRVLIGGDARLLDALQRLLPTRYEAVLQRLWGRDIKVPKR
jgi:short-subunit dehydrogenase